jgi:hypothetical protein
VCNPFWVLLFLPSQGEVPAEPHPCRERFIDPCCAAKTLASDHSVDQRSAARQEPRRPRSSTVFSQNFREPQGHWPHRPIDIDRTPMGVFCGQIAPKYVTGRLLQYPFILLRSTPLRPPSANRKATGITPGGKKRRGWLLEVRSEK